VSFLRRILGGSENPAAPAPIASAEELADDERQHELEVMREETRRLDELQQRQLRYADRAWTPPAQGGEKRADDEGTEPDAPS
jgi:hypothetical protein